MRGIYNIDSSSSIHKSHENKEVQQFYHYVLDGEPSSETSEKLFHTSYAPRGFDAILIRAVDHEDAKEAPSLCADDVISNTRTELYARMPWSV